MGHAEPQRPRGRRETDTGAPAKRSGKCRGMRSIFRKLVGLGRIWQVFVCGVREEIGATSSSEAWRETWDDEAWATETFDAFIVVAVLRRSRRD